MSVNLGLTIFFILYPGIWMFLLGLELLNLGIVPGLAVGCILGFLAQLVLLGANATGMCCCTGTGCCGQVGSAVATLVGCFIAFIAVICAAVDHAHLDAACGVGPTCVAINAYMGVFYAGVVIPMILGAITASVAAGRAVLKLANRSWGCFRMLIAMPEEEHGRKRERDGGI